MQTHHRVLMTFETEESRSSLEMKLYVMPKKTSGFSRAFCFSWLTVYTSVMESTAEAKNRTTLFGEQATTHAALVTFLSDTLMCHIQKN